MLYKNIYDTLKIEKTKDISTMTGLTVFHQSLLRDKRLVLAYLYVMVSLSLCVYIDHELTPRFTQNRNWRIERISELRWETGRVVPADINSNMGPSEIEFFQHYDDALGEYMRTVNLDLTSFVEPPKEPYIEVRALQDCGEIVSNDGTSIRLDKNSTNLVRREDVAHLIKQGLLEQLS